MNPIPSPVFATGWCILMSGFRGNDLKAISLADAKGDITARRASSGRWTAIRRMCRHPCCTTASSIS